jgi:hypothetical protein
MVATEEGKTGRLRSRRMAETGFGAPISETVYRGRGRELRTVNDF